MTWIEEATCREIGGDLWYPEKGESVAVSRRVCEDCPVRVQCARYAVEHEERNGVWGGFPVHTLKQRARLHAWLATQQAVAS